MPAHRGEVIAVTDKPLAEAKQRLRREAYERKMAEANIPTPPEPTRRTGAEYVAAMHQSRSVHDRKLAAARALFDRVAGQCSTAQLDRLIGALELFERSLTRRHT
jgi:DNA-binding LacI/PurR family transcriptional regulator